MTTFRNWIVKLALVAPVFFGMYTAEAENLADLRKDLAATAVENSVDEETKSKITLFIDREDANPNTFVRWSYNPLRYFSEGWVLQFDGFAVVTGVDSKIPARGYAFFSFKQSVDGEALCFTVATRAIVLKFAGMPERLRRYEFVGRPFTHCQPRPRK